MEMSVKTEGDLCLVSVRETRIDAPAALDFKESVRKHAQGAPAHVVLDLNEVSFIDSSGLGAIVALMKALTPDHRLSLVNLTPPVAKVFQLTHMHTIFTIFPDTASAMEARNA